MSISANLHSAYGVTPSAPTSKLTATPASTTAVAKTSESQTQAAAQLLSKLNGKGQNLDIRV